MKSNHRKKPFKLKTTRKEIDAFIKHLTNTDNHAYIVERERKHIGVATHHDILED